MRVRYDVIHVSAKSYLHICSTFIVTVLSAILDILNHVVMKSQHGSSCHTWWQVEPQHKQSWYWCTLGMEWGQIAPIGDPHHNEGIIVIWGKFSDFYTPRNKVTLDSPCLSVCLSICLFVCLSVCLLTFCVRPVASTVQDGFFPYLVQMINSMRGCVACDDPWPWPISSRSFGLDLENRVRSVVSTVLDGFFLYLAQMITIIRGCVCVTLFSKSGNLNFWQIFETFRSWPWKKIYSSRWILSIFSTNDH